MLQEKQRGSESEAIRYRNELVSEKEQSFRRLQDIESDRVKLKTENAILQEKYSQARFEIDDLKMRLNCEYSEKLKDLESQNKVHRDEVRKRDTQLVEMTNETIKRTNENSKRLALVEQERDFLKRDLQSTRDSLQKREVDHGESVRVNRERDDKIKQQRNKKKALQRELNELKANMQSTIYQQQTQCD